MSRRKLRLRSNRNQRSTQRLLGNAKPDLLLWKNHDQEKLRVMSIQPWMLTNVDICLSEGDVYD